MDNKLIESRRIVVPGETLAKGMNFLPGSGSYRKDDEIKSKVLGLTDVKGSLIKVIPLSGAYWPKLDDHVIGKVVDIGHAMWDVDINAQSIAHIPASEATRRFIDVDRTDLSRIFDIGEYVFARVIKASDALFVQLSTKDAECKKLEPGLVVKVNPAKVPRLIGKKGSMVNTIKQEADCDLLIGQNGFVWIKAKEPGKEMIALKAIRYIEENAHKEGLTEGIKTLIKGWLNEKT